MRERRALRFAIEALFLGALAAALIVADLGTAPIAGLMLLGWLVVALYEWAATREGPHYGRGLPPRYYVPQVALPPPRPLEQLPSAYPAAEFVDEEPTWIASPAMRDELLAEWPVAAGIAVSPAEDTIVDDRLFAAIAKEYREDTRPDAQATEEDEEPEPEPVAVAVAEPEAVEEAEPEPEPVVVAEAIVVTEAAVVVEEPEPVAEVAAEPEPVVVAEAIVVAEAAAVVEEPEPEPVAEVAAEPEPVVVAEAIVAAEVAEVVEEPEPEVVGAAAPVEALEVAAVVLAASGLAEPDVEAVEPEPVAAVVVAEPDPVAEPDAVAEPDVEEDVEPEEAALPGEPPLVPVAERPTRYTFDALGAQGQPRRRWRRRAADGDGFAEVPARPPRPAGLPGHSRREH